MSEKIKLLIDSYNLVCQNPSGGVRVRIENFEKNIADKLYIKRFDKWNDRVLDYDIVHIFKSSSESYTMLKYAKEHNIPVVVSSVVPSEKRFAIWVNHVLCKFLPIYSDRYLNELVLTKADAIFAQTEIEKKFIIKNFHISADKIYVIPNGVSLEDTETEKDYFEKRTGIKGDFILQVGRFDENKNQMNVIKAVNGTDMQLVLIGGPDKNSPEYFEKCKEIADENVHFLGWVDHNDKLLQSAYQSAKVVVLPSYKEIFGNSLFEGGASGANLVVSDVLPVDDWGIGKYCEKIKAGNIADIKEKLSMAFEKEKNSELMKIIKENFSWDAVTDRHIECYKEVIRRKKS